MKIGIVINTYMITEKGEQNPFDHPTPLWAFDEKNTLEGTLKSIRDAKRRSEDEWTLYLFGIAANEATAFDEEIESKMKDLVNRVGELPATIVITNAHVKMLRTQTDINFFESSGYPEIRNLGLIFPSMMGEDLIMQLDDDELIRPNHIARFAEIFEAHPEYGIVTAPYEKDGTTRILGADPLPTWRKTSSMDVDLERLLSAGDCQQAVFGFGGNLCLRTSVARQVLYPRRVPRGEDFSFLLACRLLYANGDMTADLASSNSWFLTWFCPERAVTILHHPPAEEKADFLQSFEINLKRFILERQMVATQEEFTWEDLAGQSKYLAAMFGQKDFYHQIKLWIQEIRDFRTDIPDPEWIDALESRLFAFLEEVEKEPRWQNYLRDRRKFEEAQKILEKLDVKEKLVQQRGWQT